MEDMCKDPAGPFATATSVGAAAEHQPQQHTAVAPSHMQQQTNGPIHATSGLAASTTAARAPSCGPAGPPLVGFGTASLAAIAAVRGTAAGKAAPRQFAPGSHAAALAAGQAGPPPPPGVHAVQPAAYPPSIQPSMWSNSAAAAADPAFFNILSSMMMQHQQRQQRQQPSFVIDPLNTGFHTNIGHEAAPASTKGTALNTGFLTSIGHTAVPASTTGTALNATAPKATAPAANHFYNLNIQAAGSLPGSPSFSHSTLPGSLSTAAAAAAAAFSNASLGTSSGGEACDKTCSHCGKVEQRQWRKRGDGTLLCNRCFMWRRNHGGVALPSLDGAPVQPAISKQHSLGPRASSSGGNSAHSKHGRHTNLSMNRVLQDLAGRQEAEQEISHGSRHGSGSYSKPSSPARPRSRSGSAASSPARRRRAASPDDPEYRPRGNSKLSRSTSHASDDLSAAAATSGAAARSSSGQNSMPQQQQRSKLRLRSRLAKAGVVGAGDEEEEADMGQPAGCSAGPRQLQHQGSSGRARLAAAAAAAAAAAGESDEEAVSAAEVLAELLPMACYEAVDGGREQQQAPRGQCIDAAAAPPPITSSTAHQGDVLQFLAQQQSIKEAAGGNIRAGSAAELRRSGPGSIGSSYMGDPSAAGDIGKYGPSAGSMEAIGIPSLKNSTAAALGGDMLQQQGGFSAGPSLSPAAIAKAEQAQAAAAAGAINPHVYRAILTALAAGAAADSIDLVSTQHKFEVMEQQLHVPRSPAAAHLLSRMNAMSP